MLTDNNPILLIKKDRQNFNVKKYLQNTDKLIFKNSITT